MAKKPDIQYISFYTHGSAAQKIAPAVTIREDARMPRPKKQKRKVLYVDPVAILSIAVAVCMICMLVAGFHGLQKAQDRLSVMQQHLDKLVIQHEELEQKYREDIDLENIRVTALALGMVPKEQLQTTSISVSRPAAEPEEQSYWEQLTAFLVDLLA